MSKNPKDFNDLFRTVESKCRRCTYHSPEYAGDCKLLAVGLRKIVGKDFIWLVCDDFIGRSGSAHEQDRH